MLQEMCPQIQLTERSQILFFVSKIRDKKRRTERKQEREKEGGKRNLKKLVSVIDYYNSNHSQYLKLYLFFRGFFIRFLYTVWASYSNHIIIKSISNQSVKKKMN